MATTQTRYINTGAVSGGNGLTRNLTGVDRAYDSLNAAQLAEAKDIDVATGSDEIFVLRCAGQGDSVVCVLSSSWVLSATNWLVIEADDGEEAGAVIDDTKYHYRGVGSAGALQVSDNIGKVIIRNLQFYPSASAVINRRSLGLRKNGSYANGTQVENCLFDGSRLTGANSAAIVRTSSGFSYAAIRNCVFVDYDMTQSIFMTVDLSGLKGPWKIYNCTFDHCTVAIGSGSLSGHPLVKNCAFSQCGADGDGGNHTGNNNASTNATSIGTSPRVNQTFTFIDESGNDFHLSSSDTAAYEHGVDLSGDTDNPVTTDFEGDARDGSTPDIGFDEATALGDYIFAGAMTVTTAPVASELNYTPQNPVLAGALAIVIAFAATMAYTQFSESLWTPNAPTELNTDYVPHDVAGTVYGPLTSGLQAAINSAQRGDIIVLADGSEHIGNFTLPGKSGTQPINIVSESFFNGPLAKGVGDRIDPSDLAKMATIRTPNAAPAIDTLNGGPDASYYRFEWIRIAVVQDPAFVGSAQFGVVRFSYTDTLSGGDVTPIPRNLILSHCIVDGTIGASFGDAKKCVELNCREGAIIDCYLDHDRAMLGFEGHAIDGYKGPGPFKIDNNYIRSPGIGILWGGANNQEIVNTQGASQPADISTTRNYFVKDMSWYNVAGIVVKNWIESKNSVRNLIRGNVFSIMWGNQGQAGHSVLMQNTIGASFTNLDQWKYQQIRDTHIIYNKFLDGSGGPNVAATINRMDLQPGPEYAPEPVTRWVCEHNLWYGIASTLKGGGTFGRFYSPTGPVQYCVLDHNTAVLQSDEVVLDNKHFFTIGNRNDLPPHVLYGWPSGSRCRGNIFNFGQYGIFGDGGYVGDKICFPEYDPSMDYDGNLVYGKANPNANQYELVSTDNVYVGTMAECDFVNAAAGDFTLNPTSPGIDIGPGGTPAGADIAQLNIETEHCVDGQWGSGQTGIILYEAPADAADGVAFGVQPILQAGAGVVVTAAQTAGSGTLAGPLTATCDANGLAQFQRLRIDGEGLHTIRFSAPGYDPAVSVNITSVASTSGDVQVDESTELQVWEGTNDVAQIMQYEAPSQAYYDADKAAVLAMVDEYAGPMTILLAWRIGCESDEDYFDTHGPIPFTWGLMLADLYGNWVPEPTGTIYHTKQAYDLDEVYEPLRVLAAANGHDKPRLQILYHATNNEPDGFRPTSTGGDLDGSTYAARVLELIQWIDANYANIDINEDVEVSLKNEPNFIGLWTQTDLAYAARATRDLLDTNGYTGVRILFPTTSNEGTCVAWYNGIVTAVGATAAGTAGAISVHRYGRDATARANIKALGASEGLPIVMDEWIVSTGTYQQHWEETVDEMGASGVSLFILAFGTALDGGAGWVAMFGDGSPVLTDIGRVFAAYGSKLRRNSQRIGATESHASVASAFCFVEPGSKHTTIIRMTGAASFTVGGLPASTYRLYETLFSGGAVHNQKTDVVVANGGTASVTSTGAGILVLTQVTEILPPAVGAVTVTVAPVASALVINRHIAFVGDVTAVVTPAAGFPVPNIAGDVTVTIAPVASGMAWNHHEAIAGDVTATIAPSATFVSGTKVLAGSVALVVTVAAGFAYFSPASDVEYAARQGGHGSDLPSVAQPTSKQGQGGADHTLPVPAQGHGVGTETRTSSSAPTRQGQGDADVS
jgi:uncharacterized protein YjbI with pentapeptide repeats